MKRKRQPKSREQRANVKAVIEKHARELGLTGDDKFTSKPGDFIFLYLPSPKAKLRAAKTAKPAEKREADYRHPEVEAPLRPDVGTQAQFRKKKPPATYRYDSSLSPALDWDGQNPAREQSEAAIREILDLDTGAIESAASADDAQRRLRALLSPERRPPRTN